ACNKNALASAILRLRSSVGSTREAPSADAAKRVFPVAIPGSLTFSSLAGIEHLKLGALGLAGFLICRRSWRLAYLLRSRERPHLHCRAQLVLHLVERRERVLENPALQRGYALKPLQFQQRPLLALHGQHPLLRIFRRFRQHKTTGCLGYMKADGSP